MLGAFVLTVIFSASVAVAQEASVEAKSGPLDNGKMWLFENPPLDYLEATYGFRPDAAWLERARLSVLRVPGCSASFVSSNGLVVTNHHCVRGRLPSVQLEGESLLDDGFIARDLADERRIPGYYADQLIAVEDVTDEIDRAAAGAQTDAERNAAIQEAEGVVVERLSGAFPEADSVVVQVVALYNGGRRSAYVFRRYIDVRFVTAVELQMGFFGGDGDNFTYPRYALDYSFLRVYGDDGRPIESPNHFTFSDKGISEGDLIFVIGNPGSTARQLTVAQLEYLRDVTVAVRSGFLSSRLEAYRAFYAADPATGDAMNMRNMMFGISNSEKAYAGRLDALNDPYVIARRLDKEREFRESIAADPALASEYGQLHDAIAVVADEMRGLARPAGAFAYLANRTMASSMEQRMVYAWTYLTESAAGGDSERAANARRRLLSVGDIPAMLERSLLELRLADFESYLGIDDPVVMASIPADALLETSLLASAEATARAVEDGTLTLRDPALQLADVFMPRVADYESAEAGLQGRLGPLQTGIGRARYAVYGNSVPPDATFSPRFTDGVVQGYEYNGTLAPWHTTLYGMYDRYYGFGDNPDWALPDRWKTPPEGLDLSTPLNFCSTSDTIGGNSGSPAVTRDLEVVGLNFDRNIEGLVRDYMYIPERGRNVMVDMRSVKETLDKVYDADRVVLELTTGVLVDTEAEADAQ